MSEKRCLVAICHNGPVILTETAQSLMELGWGNRVESAKQAHGFAAIDFTWQRSFPRVDALRDAAAMLALEEGEIRPGVVKPRYSHLLFLDADMGWPSDVLTRMLRHHATGIVSAFYCLKGGDFAPVALNDGGHLVDGVRQYYHDRDYEETGSELRDVDAVGMGCTLIPTAAFEAIGPRPWFTYEYSTEGWPVVSEDVPFCRKAKQAGFRICWDPTVKCLHYTTHGITPSWHRAAKMGVLGAVLEAAHLEPTAA